MALWICPCFLIQSMELQLPWECLISPLICEQSNPLCHFEVNMAADGRKVKLIKSLLFSDRELDDKKCVRWWVSVKNSV